MSRRLAVLLVGAIAAFGIAAAVLVQVAVRSPAPGPEPRPLRASVPPPPTPTPAPPPPARPPPPAAPTSVRRAAAPDPGGHPSEVGADDLARRLGPRGADAVRRAVSTYVDLCWQPVASRLPTGEAPEFAFHVRFDPSGKEILREVRPVLHSSRANPTQAEMGSAATQQARREVEACAAGVRDLPAFPVTPPGEVVDVTLPVGSP